jgi:hypothetical protein
MFEPFSALSALRPCYPLGSVIRPPWWMSFPLPFSLEDAESRGSYPLIRSLCRSCTEYNPPTYEATFLWSPSGRLRVVFVVKLLFCVSYNVTVSVLMQLNIYYIIFLLSSPSLHVSALLGHPQVSITVLNCHNVYTVLFFYHTLWLFI